MKNLTKALFPTLALCIGILANVSANSSEIKVLANDAVEFDSFGVSTSVSGDYAIVGAMDNENGGIKSGSAYIYQKNGASWTQQTKLVANDGADSDYFGRSVFIDGDYAIVSAYKDDDDGTDSGSAYIFYRSGASWTQQAKLTASDAIAEDQFGVSVAINGDYAIIGSHWDDDGGAKSGSAYIFHRSGTTWTEQAKLTANDAAAYDYFGYAVSIDGDYAVVGAYFDDDEGANTGSAYFFHRSGASWTQEDKVTSNDPNAGGFARSVSIDGDYTIIGAEYDDLNGIHSGSVFVFLRNGSSWIQQTRLIANDGTQNDNFGNSVSLEGEYLIVGAWKDDANGLTSGSTYIFNRSGSSWKQLSKVNSSVAESDDLFGTSVSISGSNVIVGSPGEDDNGSASGAAYFYSISSSGNLVLNASCEDDLVGGEIPNWTETSGTKWTQRNSSPNPQDGSNYFYAGSQSGNAELQQDVDVSAYSISIDAGNATFNWSSFVSSKHGLDSARVILEYRDATNTNVLDTFDSGLYSPDQVWVEITDSRIAPAGTRFVKIKLQSDRGLGPQNNGHHDNLWLFTTSTSDADQPLAVELDSFQARQIENTIQLTWSTASETENKGFNVYKKTGNGSFIQIASYKSHNELLGQGNSTFQNNYSFADNSFLRNDEFYTYYISDVETNGLETKHEEQSQTVKFVLGAEEVNTKKEYKLAQNFPNPFNPSTTIAYKLAKDTRVSLKIYNVKGEFVKELTNGFQQEGYHSVVWNGTDSFGKLVSSGTYFYKLQAGTFTQINKMILLK